MNEGQDHTVRGRVALRGNSNKGLRVELLAPDRAELFDCAITDETGAFTLSPPYELLTALLGDARPRMFFRVFLGDRPLADTRGEVEWSPADGPANVRIEVTQALRDSDLRPTPSVVRGRLTDAVGRPVAKATIEALDKNLRPKETLIGTAVTDRDGAFSVRYQPSQLGRPGKHKADLVLELVQSERVRHHLFGPRCRADTTLELALSLGIGEGTPAYERLMAAVQPALGELALGGLDDEDAEYLACSLALDEDAVQELVSAHRLAPDLRVEPDVAWALVHAGLPAELEALLERGRSAWQAAIDGAIRTNGIARRDDEIVAASLDRLTAAATEHIATSERARFASLMRTVRDPDGRELVDDRHRKTIVEAWVRHEGSPDALWEELERGELAEVAPHVQRTLRLSAMTRDHLPLVAAVQKRFAAENLVSLRDLAAWRREDWETLIAAGDDDGPVGVPAGIEGDDEASRRARYAELMTREVETAFPTRVLAQRVAADERLADRDLVAFFEEHPDFEMKEAPLGDWLARHPDALARATDPSKLEARLRAAERLVRITPRQEVLRAAMADNLSSAAELHAMGKARLRKRLARQGSSGAVTAEIAEAVWTDICWNSIAAQALVGKMHPNLQGPKVYAIQGAQTKGTSGGTVSDLTTLFGSLSSCACEHCRSVFSPAAYLVDLLQFLHRYEAKQLKVETLKLGPFVEQAAEVNAAVLEAIATHALQMDRITETLPERARTTMGDASLSLASLVSNPSEFLVGHVEDDVAEDPEIQKTFAKLSGVAKDILAAHPNEPLLEFRRKTARDILLRRRRDIGHLPLTCDNTDTLVPYIDLVNEALEHRLVDKAFDEEAHDAAYEVLAENVFPWSLPFHLWESEARVWLAHLGTSRAELMAALPPQGTSEAIARAGAFDRIGLTKTASNTLGSASPWRMWGFDAEEALSDWVAKPATVAELMRRAEVSYEELVDVVTTAFVTQGDELEIAPLEADDILSCDPSKLYVKRLSATSLERIHLFERTRRALGWSIADVDRAIAVFGPEVDVALLERLATVETLRARLKRPVEEMLAWWGPLDVTPRGREESSSYDGVFLDPRLGVVDPALAWDGEAGQVVAQGADVAAHQAAVLAALGVSADELRLLTDEAECMAVLGRSAPMPNAKVDRETLTALYRHVRCARALRLRVPAFLRLLALSGLDPFDDQLEDAVTLAELAARLRERDVAIAELDHVVRGVPFAKGEVDAALMAQVLEDIVAELSGLLAETRNADPNAKAPPPKAIRLRAVEAVVARLAAALQLDERLVRVLVTTILRDNGTPVIEPFVADLDPEHAASLATARRQAIRRLHKAGRMASIAGTSPEELEALHALDGWLDDDAMPLALAAQGSRFEGYARLDRLMRTRERLRGGGKTLVTLMGMAAGTLASDGARLPEGDPPMTASEIHTQVAALAGWAREDVDLLVQDFGFAHPFAWTDGTAIVALVDAFEQLHRLSASAAAAKTWATPEPDLSTWQAIAKDVHAAARSQRDADAWAEAARPVEDELRAKRRDALVAALLQDGPYESTTDLYDALLLDVEMDPCRMTSRLKQAISATQLFIQRCFLNLERNVQLDEDAAREWTWRKNYRVWEANRKVFLYPENWIQGRLRDDKTPLFLDVERHLLQGELTDERTESAVFGYIDGLEQLSHLEVLTVLERNVPAKGTELHLFAKGADQSVWHRMRETSRRWQAWEKVPFDIEGKLLMACVTPTHQVRALWVNELEGEYDDAEDVERWAHLRLAWSDLTHSGWTPVRSSADQKIVGFPDSPKARGRWHVRAWGETIQVVFHTAAPLQFLKDVDHADPQRSKFSGIENGGFHFAHAGAPPVAWWESKTRPGWLWFTNKWWHTRLATEFKWQHGGQVEHDAGATERSFKPPMGADENRFTVLSATPHGGVRVVADPSVARVDGAPFVFQDDRYGFVVSPVIRRMATAIAPGTSVELGPSKPAVRFEMLHHPLAGDFARRAYTHGIDDLYRWDGADSIQLRSKAEETFFSAYEPKGSVVDERHPVIDVDFSWRGATSPYNWELFFHVPFFIGEQLTQRRRFEDAMHWFQRIFDPTTGSDAPVPARFWKVRPFYEAALSEDGEMPSGIGVASESAQIAAWEDDPFNPHLVARMRPVAYQKAVVMKYLDNIVAWADQLFRRHSIESLNEATQLYLLASKILGPRPTSIEPRADVEGKTYLELADGLDAFSNALVDVESYVPPRPQGWTCGGGHGLALPTMPYFCTPPNEQLLAYWDKVEDRLFKIRHCMDIGGRVRQLPLFEAPIDPGVLVRARAAGVDIGAVLAGLAFERPALRFEVMLRRAQDLVGDVKQLGAALGAALEKRDAEQLSQLRQSHELDALRHVRDERKLAIKEARETLASLQKAREQARLRKDFFENRDRWTQVEAAANAMAAVGGGLETGAGVLQSIAAGVAPIPQIHTSVTPGTEQGGAQAARALEAAAHALRAGASGARIAQGALDREATRYRRDEDWDHAARVATEEIAQLDKQIAASELRMSIAEQQLASHDLAIRQSREVGDFLRTKFSDDELYDWMIGELSAVYFQLYELAYEVAKKAEVAFRFELGLETSDYVSFGYWSDLRKGLLAGDKLGLDLRRLEMAHVERDARELELSRSISLVLHDPAALMTLKTTGSCTFTLPEELFDADYPGHYFRRLRNVTLTIPCVAGPYTPVNCRLSLQSSKIRVDPVKVEPYLDAAEGEEPAPDTRFRRNLVPGSSIATSTARNDAGLFEVSFGGPRYLPFEGAGVVSSWTIDLPRENNGFDVDTITDVVLRLDYTARDGGATLAGPATEHLEGKRASSGHLRRLISLRHEMREAWEQLIRPEDATKPAKLDLTTEHFPFLLRAQAQSLVLDGVTVFANRPWGVPSPSSADLTIATPEGAPATFAFEAPEATFAKAEVKPPDTIGGNPLGTWTLEAQDPAAFTADNLRDLWLLVEYRVDAPS
jgi:Tc toxin complex TcA C-terminal TcB-binding domain/ABC toxin N-terminal region/Salmonella virulence plasmid 28.1kDa A protein